MKNKVIWSFLSVVGLASGALMAGCDSDAKLARSALGESCDNTADCDDGLKCVNDTCSKPGSSSSGGSSSVGDGDGGEHTTGATAGTAPVVVPPVLGNVGESCTRRADCKDGLGCYSQRCQTAGDGGEGGEGSVGVSLGSVGETCQLTSDCTKGLACKPLNQGYGSLGIGVCTQQDSGLIPTGKVCGAECAEAADCCELPIAQQTATGASSCTALAKLVGDVANCDTATGANGVLCLAYNSYCDDNCGSKTWACTNGACIYEAKCTKTTQVIGGCPAVTRGGTAIPTCDTKTSKCTGPVADVTGCGNDDDCTDTAVADYPTYTCVEGECTCHKATGLCYRKCSETLDCEVGYTCNDDSLCVPVPGCSDDTQCIKDYGDVRAVCTDGTCNVPCEHDVDCNDLTNSNFSRVCGPDKTCVDLGCKSDDECEGFTGGQGVRSFCTEPRTTVDGTEIIHSAITD